MNWQFSVSEHSEIQRDVIIDVDPESVRKGVRNLMQQVAQIERERVRKIDLIFVLFF